MTKDRLANMWGTVVAIWKFMKDPNAPWYKKLPVILALIYVVNPFDLFPDYVPMAGWIDDLLVVFAAISLIRRSLVKYKNG